MEYLIYIIAFIADIVVTGVILWAAAMMTRVNLVLKETIICSFAASLVALIPSIGWLISLIVLFYLLKKYSDANIWPNLILMVIVSRFFAFLANFLLLGFINL